MLQHETGTYNFNKKAYTFKVAWCIENAKIQSSKFHKQYFRFVLLRFLVGLCTIKLHIPLYFSLTARFHSATLNLKRSVRIPLKVRNWAGSKLVNEKFMRKISIHKFRLQHGHNPRIAVGERRCHLLTITLVVALEAHLLVDAAAVLQQQLTLLRL